MKRHQKKNNKTNKKQKLEQNKKENLHIVRPPKIITTAGSTTEWTEV